MLKITGTMMLVLMLTTLTASAAWLVPTESDQSSTSEAYLTAATTINGNGMYVPIPDTYHTNNMTYSSFSPGETGMMWLSNLVGDAAPSVYYGFDSLVTIDTLKIWNFNDESQLDASIEEAQVRYTTDTGLPLASRTWIDAGTIVLTRGTGSGYYVGNAPIDATTLGLDGVEITGLMLEVLDTYGSEQAGLSEIHFEGEVVPEPATMGLLAVGGIAMLRSRRRRNKK